LNKAITDTGRHIAKKHIKLAILVTFIICSLWYLFGGYAQMKSALLAGLIAIIPNSIFAYKTFKYVGAQASGKVVESFFQGEKLKIVVTAILFAIAFKFFLVMPLPFFITYCIVMVLPLLLGFFKL
jgi:ATP synthase protein I